MPSIWSRMPAMEFEQFGLAIAGDTGNADDFAGANLEADALDARHLEIVGDDEVVDIEQYLAGAGGAFFDAEEHATTNHQLGQFAGRSLLGGEGFDHRALAHDRDFVGDGHDLTQLVRDEDDGFAFFAQFAEDAEEMIGLVGVRRRWARRE